MYCVEETTEQGRSGEINNRDASQQKQTGRISRSQGVSRRAQEGVRRKHVPAPRSSPSSEGSLIFHFSIIPVALLLMNSFITSDLGLNGTLPMTVRDGRGHKDTEFSA